jgi:hypothetical protein
MKNFNKLYYILTFTWGILPNILGLFVSLFFKYILKAETKMEYGRCVFIAGNDWGGLSLGNFVFMSKSAASDSSILSHEIGHSLQNIIWGPLFLFVIGIPSATRCWYRETSAYIDHPEKHTDYDAIWFEGQATEWGTKYVEAYNVSKDVQK